MATFRPMLAAKASVSDVVFPCIGSPKVDGLRCLAMQGRPMSRSMKPLRNRHLQGSFAEHGALLEGLDGEIVVGDPTDPDCYRITDSAIMREAGEPEFRFLTFDRWDSALPYEQRLQLVAQAPSIPWLQPLASRWLSSVAELDAYESDLLEQGYEGVMVRKPDGPYKQNRSTVREGYLLKIKRFEDAEALVIGYEEEFENQNEAQLDERGFTKRSTHKANMVGKDTLGKLIVRGLPGTRFAGEEFSLGLAISDEQAKALWAVRDSLIGRISTYRFFPIGCKDKPRFPQHHGFRDPLDMDSSE